ncbi:MAG: alpha-L-glutamate ligase, partial [Bacteroidetes bacterium]|nr:alpha-L-glutamate ligase [Bacteroidota bacterium]
PFILKPNRGGKGQGVELLRSIGELERRLNDSSKLSLDGISLVQEYIKPHNESITRLEFIGGRFFYGVRVDTSEGFELCPADSCEVGEAYCPAPGDASKQKFTLLDDFQDTGLISRLETFFSANEIEIGAAEFVENEKGQRFVYDININTNYNRQAEINAGDEKRAMMEVARFLKNELEEIDAELSKEKENVAVPRL